MLNTVNVNISKSTFSMAFYYTLHSTYMLLLKKIKILNATKVIPDFWLAMYVVARRREALDAQGLVMGCQEMWASKGTAMALWAVAAPPLGPGSSLLRDGTGQTELCVGETERGVSKAKASLSSRATDKGLWVNGLTLRTSVCHAELTWPSSLLQSQKDKMSCKHVSACYLN